MVEQAETPEETAAIRSTSAPNAGLAFTVLPTCSEHTIISPVFNQIVRIRLFLPPHDMPKQLCGMHHCDVDVSDPSTLTHHHFSCPKLKRREITVRHDLVTHALVQIAHSAGFLTCIEPRTWDENGKRKQPDAVLYHLTRPPTYVDVSVTHPAAESYRTAAAQHSLSAVL